MCLRIPALNDMILAWREINHNGMYYTLRLSGASARVCVCVCGGGGVDLVSWKQAVLAGDLSVLDVILDKCKLRSRLLYIAYFSRLVHILV